MNRLLRRIAAAALAVLATGCELPIPPSAESILRNGDHYRLMLLRPDVESVQPSPRDFHHYAVDKSIPLADVASTKKLIAALNAYLGPNEPLACMFDPRYGLHITRGTQTADFLICFKCGQVQVFVNNQEVAFPTIDAKARPIFAWLIPE